MAFNSIDPVSYADANKLIGKIVEEYTTRCKLKNAELSFVVIVDEIYNGKVKFDSAKWVLYELFNEIIKLTIYLE